MSTLEFILWMSPYILLGICLVYAYSLNFSKIKKLCRIATFQYLSIELFYIFNEEPRGILNRDTKDCIIVKDREIHKNCKDVTKKSKIAKMAEKLGFTKNKWDLPQEPSPYDNTEFTYVYYVTYELGNKGIHAKYDYDIENLNEFHWMVVRARLAYYGWILFGGGRILFAMAISGMIGFFIGMLLTDIFPNNPL